MLRTRIYRLLFWAARAAALPPRAATPQPDPTPQTHPATTRATLSPSPRDEDRGPGEPR